MLIIHGGHSAGLEPPGYFDGPATVKTVAYMASDRPVRPRGASPMDRLRLTAVDAPLREHRATLLPPWIRSPRSFRERFWLANSWLASVANLKLTP